MDADHYLPVYFTDHSLDSMRKRGTNQDEIIQTIREAEWREAKHGRIEAEKEFLFDDVWNGKHYARKKVNPVFLIESGTIIVVTIYCFYY